MKKHLKDVTLLAISSIKISETIIALNKCCEQLSFGAVKFISHECPKDLPDYITYEYCPEIKNINDFNHYVFENLYKHVDTSHCLMVQFHAWIVRPELWDDKWLDYDYIGAPWAYRNDSYICHDTGEHCRVGNGGFSLRSKKLMQIPSQYNIPLTQEQGWYNEDGNIVCYHRVKFLSYGIKYAPVEVAARFSYEVDVPENLNILPFGFHRNIK